MKATPTLIAAMRRAADRIEDKDGGYEWGDTHSCNCGILVQELLDMSPIALRNNRAISGTWRSLLRTYERVRCHHTGMAVVTLINELMRHGLESEDFRYIEDAGTYREVDEREGQFSEPVYVAKFFRELADKLEAQLNQEQEQELTTYETEQKVNQSVAVRRS